MTEVSNRGLTTVLEVVQRSSQVVEHSFRKGCALGHNGGMRLPSMPTLHIRLLGSFHMLYGEALVLNVDSPRLQAPLTYLLLQSTRSLAEEMKRRAALG